MFTLGQSLVQCPQCGKYVYLRSASLAAKLNVEGSSQILNVKRSGTKCKISWGDHILHKCGRR
jgi:hypothetical protein